MLPGLIGFNQALLVLPYTHPRQQFRYQAINLRLLALIR